MVINNLKKFWLRSVKQNNFLLNSHSRRGKISHDLFDSCSNKIGEIIIWKRKLNGKISKCFKNTFLTSNENKVTGRRRTIISAGIQILWREAGNDLFKLHLSY